MSRANIDGLQQSPMSQEQLTSIAAGQMSACCTVHHITQAVFAGKTMATKQIGRQQAGRKQLTW